MRIPPGQGYWDTTRDGIGLAFRRAGSGGVPLAELLRTFRRCHSATAEYRAADGRRVAVDRAAVEA